MSFHMMRHLNEVDSGLVDDFESSKQARQAPNSGRGTPNYPPPKTRFVVCGPKVEYREVHRVKVG